MSSRGKVAVLGAGFSGLVVARELIEQGVDIQVFEAAARWGGLAQTFRMGEYLYDFGPHYITNRLANDLGVMDECVHVDYAESICHAGKLYAFPFGLMTKPSFAIGAGLGLIRNTFSSDRGRTAAEFFRRSCGSALAEEILCPLVRKWSGVDPDALSVDFVDRVPPPSLGVLWRKLLGVVTRKSVQVMPGQGHVYHVEPREGIQVLSDRLAGPIADRISLATPVERILVRDGRTHAIVADGKTHECDAVVSTLPAPVLPDLIEGSNALDSLRELRFRPIMLAFLVVKRPRVLDRLLTWFPDAEQTFYRLSEQKIACADVAPADSTLLTIEMTCDESEPLWSRDEADVRRQLVAEIGAVYGIPADDFGEMVLRRTRFGYPMYDLDFDDVRKGLADEDQGIAGLHLVGRTGRFRYILLEESRRQALGVVAGVLRGLEGTI